MAPFDRREDQNLLLSAPSPSVTVKSDNSSLFTRELVTVAVLFIVCALAFIPYLGATGLLDPTDSFFIEGAREMLESGRFLVPMMNYELWCDKPALAFDFIVASYKAFGVNEFAGRLPSALSGIFIVLSTYVLSRKMLSRRQAIFSALALLSFPLFGVVGHTSLTDEPLCLCITVAILCFAVRMFTGGFNYLIGAYVALSVGVLIKGPLALILVGLILVGFLLLTGPKQIIPSVLKLHPILGTLIMSALVVPYYVCAHNDTHGEFTKTFFLRQNFGRMTGVVNHVRPFWFYIPIVAAGIFPWSTLAVFAAKPLKLLTKLRSRLITRRQKLLVLSLCWSTLGFVFFSIIPTKLETYIVPILPGVAILIGCLMDVVVRLKKVKPLVVIICSLLVGCALIPICIIGFLHAEGVLRWFGCASAVSFALLAIALLIVCVRRRVFLATATIFGATVYACAVYIPLLFYLFHAKEQQLIDNTSHYAYAHNANLAIVRYELPSLEYLYHKKILTINCEEEMRKFADASDGPQWILVHNDVLSLLSWTERSPRVVIHDGKYWLFSIGRNAINEDTVEWHGLGTGYEYPEFKK